jgi:hypothetical protein
MRVLKYDQIVKDKESNMAFGYQLIRAIDPRLITHRPRDIEKAILMKELGMDLTMAEAPSRKKSKS